LRELHRTLLRRLHALSIPLVNAMSTFFAKLSESAIA
jgi:hypothetical protein